MCIRDSINAIPHQLKLSIGAGIGFFIAFIGFKNAGIIVGSDSTFVALGDLTNPVVLLALFGILITIILMAKKVPAAVFYGLVITAVVGIIFGLFGVEGCLLYTSINNKNDFLFDIIKDNYFIKKH